MGLSKEMQRKLDGKDDLDRLDVWRESRLEEEERVKEARNKPRDQRTQQDWNCIAYSPFGTASKCGY